MVVACCGFELLLGCFVIWLLVWCCLLVILVVGDLLFLCGAFNSVVIGFFMICTFLFTF